MANPTSKIHFPLRDLQSESLVIVPVYAHYETLPIAL